MMVVDHRFLGCIGLLLPLRSQVLGRVSLELDAEHAKMEATRQGYLEKLWYHMARIKRTLHIDKMLKEKKWDLKILAALVDDISKILVDLGVALIQGIP
jgi:hypothetical protein